MPPAPAPVLRLAAGAVEHPGPELEDLPRLLGDRDELIGRRIRAMAEKLCGGSLVPILSHLARSKGLSQKERRALRELIDSPGDAAPPGDPKHDEETDKGEGGRSRRGRE